MESYNALLIVQQKLVDDVKTIYNNFRKDSPSRKLTLEYHTSRLEKLEAYWAEFKKNDVQLSLLGVEKVGPYYEKSVYDQLELIYKETKAMLMASKASLLKMEGEKLSQPAGDWDMEAPGSSGVNTNAQNTNLNNTDRHNTNAETQEKFDQKTLDILNEQRSNIRAFERAVRNVDIANLKEKWQLEDKLRAITQRWEKVDETYWKLDNVVKDMKAYESDYNRLERLYEYTKEQINKKIWDSKHQEKATPKIELPNFNGNYAQWTTFKDLFIEMVHRNTFISNAQKMQHLKSKLKGEPERLVQHLNISADNYAACWQILQQRYDNTRLLFTYHANTLLGQPALSNASAFQLKKMHDVTVECIHAIKNLHIDTGSWDPLLVHILQQKLDSETTQSFIESLDDPKGMPSLDDFLKFIENKFMSLETSMNTARTRSANNFENQNNRSVKTNSMPIYNKPKIPHQKQYEQKNSLKIFHNSRAVHNSVIKCPKCGQQHGLYNCHEFLTMSPAERLKTVANLNICKNCLFSHNGQECTSTKTCKFCREAHSSRLHDAYKNVGQRLSTHITHDNPNEVLLATVQVKVMASDGTYIVLRALLDQGSQVSLITENAAQRLQLKRNKLSAVISGIGATPSNKCKGVVTLQCQALHNDFTLNVEALIMQTLTSKLPNKTINSDAFEHLKHIQLADPQFNVSMNVDVLLGADVYSDILLEGLIRTNSSSIIAQQTQFGWVVCGKYKSFYCNVVINNLQDMSQFWELESMQDNAEEIDPNDKCEQLYTQTTTRLTDGRYQVCLPLKPDLEQNLGASKPQAIAQFKQLERKFQKNPTYATDYSDFIKEYENMGHMKLVDNDYEHAAEYFLPHHGVVRPGAVTTKLRVVFNASAKTSSKHSLNDLMETGPNLQRDIFCILLKWRQYRYVLTADIEKMYRFIAVHPDHQSLQKIIWRDSPSKLLNEYQLCTVTYGTKAAPYLALRTLKQLAIDDGDKYPEAKPVLLNQFYVDDAIFGRDTLEEAKQTRNQLIQLLNCGGFKLRKWSSNEPQLIDDLPEDMKSPINFTFTDSQTAKALGLAWNPKEDTFVFSPTLKPKQQQRPATKREVLSEISTIFDPLGYLSPITVKCKILFQQIWKHKTAWDETVPDVILREWTILRSELANMEPFKLERWIGIDSNTEYEIHAFCDASEKAYACSVYSRIPQKHGIVHVKLISAKTKVAPIQKQQTLPRLELCAAQLLARLIDKTKQCLNKPNIKVTAWTDSMVVLGWLNGDVTRWKAFVANRVKEITAIIPSACWNHVKSEQNPADCASRGLLPSQLKQFKLWFEGPEWLRSGELPVTQKRITTEIEIKKVHTVTTTQSDDNIITQLLIRNSCLTKTINTLTWVSRFIINTSSHRRDRRLGHLTLAEIRNASNMIIRHEQNKHYGTEIKALKHKNSLNSHSRILKLNPWLDKNNILRVGGRLQNSDLSENAKHPVIVPKDSRLTQLLINQAHATTLHGGARLTLATLRQRYWIIGGNHTVKGHLKTCVRCCRYRTTNPSQLMADLPTERITQSPPFYHTGVDFTGWVEVKINKGRGVKTSKGYVVVFVCMATKAVHLELATDLSTPTFVLALKRMISRRGCPKHIYSDNGTNFVGAEKELHRQMVASETYSSTPFAQHLNELGIEWHFNAPSWPSAGGLWEAAVKSMKYHLKRVLGEQKLTYEEFLTLLTQIEACMNSRPLCPLTEDINDLEYLTPAHFLIGRPILSLPHENLEEQHVGLRNRWQMLEKMKQGFWRRWSLDYLQQLQTRNKWQKATENLAVGEIVLIKEDNLPPSRWALGRILKVHPGRDGLTRVVTLKTKTGELTRPIIKLIKLPTADQPQQTQKADIATSDVKPDTTTSDAMSGTTIADKDKTNQTAEQSKYKTRSKTKGSNILYTLLTLITLFHPTQQASQLIETTQFNTNRAIYYDKVGNLQGVHDNWKLVAYYNMTSYWLSLENVHRLENHLEALCKHFDYQVMCKAILSEVNQEISELDHNNYMLKTHHGQVRGRGTRGLVNGVGYIANSLFGILDDSFSEQYKKDIEALHKNRDHMLTLIKGQTTILEAHNNILKRNEEAMNRQFELISEHLNTTKSYIQKLGNKIEKVESMDYFNSMAIATNIILARLRHIQHMLTETATNIHHGHVDTRLLPQNQLLQELNTISGHLPKHLSIPVDDLQVQLADVYKLLEVKSRMVDSYFIIEITIPLTSDNQYTIYRAIPVPLPRYNNTLTMKLSSELIAINIRKEIYMQLSDQDLKHCIKIEPATYVCSLHKPTLNMRNPQAPCEIGTITNSTSNCTYITNTCYNKWTSLNTPNTWLYTCCSECITQVICQEHMTSRSIKGTGIVRIQEGCVVKNGEETFYTQKYYRSSTYINPRIMSSDFSDINNLTSSHPIQPASIQLNTPLRTQEYELLQSKIFELQTQTAAGDLTDHDIHQYVISYVTFGLILVAAVGAGSYYAWRRSKRNKTREAWGPHLARAAAHSRTMPPPKPPRTPIDEIEMDTIRSPHYATPHFNNV